MHVECGILFVDVFEYFTETSHKTYDLDSAYSFNISGFACQCIPSISNVSWIRFKMPIYSCFSSAVSVEVSVNTPIDVLKLTRSIYPIMIVENPLYVGVAILDLSKIVLYEFLWNYLLKKLAPTLYIQIQIQSYRKSKGMMYMN